jgi:hypothetical protein
MIEPCRDPFAAEDVFAERVATTIRDGSLSVPCLRSPTARMREMT